MRQQQPNNPGRSSAPNHTDLPTLLERITAVVERFTQVLQLSFGATLITSVDTYYATLIHLGDRYNPAWLTFAYRLTSWFIEN